MQPLATRLATEIKVQQWQIEAAIQLLDEGATVPFIARYRKEVTGALDDIQLRLLEERLAYLRELDERRTAIIEQLQQQQQLTPELAQQLQAAETKTRLEDIYLPYRPKRRTKAQKAKEAGLEPLADRLLQDPTQVPEQLAATYLNPEHAITDTKAALDGARQILMERFAEDADLAGKLRDFLWESGLIQSQVIAGKEQEGAKFSDYFAYQEPIARIPSHRALALLRGRNAGILRLELMLEETDAERPEHWIQQHFGITNNNRAADPWLAETVRWTWRVKLFSRLELELKTRLKEIAEEEAIRVFASNLRDRLLASPAGQRPIIGLDPGLRTGVKVAVVDATGKLLDTATIYPHPPQRQWEQALVTLAQLVNQHQIKLIAIGNGTASRETERLVAELLKQISGVQKVVVSEAGASVYSASELASQEFPSLDVALRGAVSIARRLQDPLAELVKIDPKAIGVGQYQHDVNQGRLARTLDHVVEDCVNAVGVDVNTASVPLLARISGLTSNLARQIVFYREQHGAFADRQALKQVPRLGEKTFEQAAGFLRITDGLNPLDASAVHPEAYPVVEQIVLKSGQAMQQLIGNHQLLRKLDPQQFIDKRFGLLTVRDILTELEKPGRDPRPEFRTAQFQEGVEQISDLQPGMVLEGVVTNVTNFGAFVDIGVHQDGLVHISAMSDRFIRDPAQIVKTGDLVRVKVLEIDQARHRIALTLRLSDAVNPESLSPKAVTSKPAKKKRRSEQQPSENAFAAAFARARQQKENG